MCISLLFQDGGDSAIAAAIQEPRGNSEAGEGVPIISTRGKHLLLLAVPL